MWFEVAGFGSTDGADGSEFTYRQVERAGVALRFMLRWSGSLLGEARSFCMGCLDSGRKPRQVDQPSLRACVLHDGSWGKELGLWAVPPRDPSTLCFLKHRLLAWGPGP